MIREQNFFLELLNRIEYQNTIIRTAAVNLGGTTGPSGGSGAPPGGFYGQLPQIRVAGDSTESFVYTSGSVSSLLDNLNNIRAWEQPATWFMAHEQYPAANTLTVMPGVWHFSSGSVLLWAGGTSPANSLPVSNPRIDLLTINTSGVLNWTRGAEAATPTRPTVPSPTSGSLPIAYVYFRTSGSAIHNHDEGQNYVDYDVRPYLAWGTGGSGTSITFDSNSPQDIGSAAVVGTSGSSPRGDHVHRGVHSVRASSGSNLYGDVVLTTTGSNISITQSSGSLIFGFTSGSSGGGHVIQDEGSALTQRTNLNFTGTGVNATDDSANDASKVYIPRYEIVVDYGVTPPDPVFADFDDGAGGTYQDFVYGDVG